MTLHTASMLEASGLSESSLDIEVYLKKAVGVLVSYTMAQHFNVRLHAQVTFSLLRSSTPISLLFSEEDKEICVLVID